MCKVSLLDAITVSRREHGGWLRWVGFHLARPSDVGSNHEAHYPSQKFFADRGAKRSPKALGSHDLTMRAIWPCR